MFFLKILSMVWGLTAIVSAALVSQGLMLGLWLLLPVTAALLAGCLIMKYEDRPWLLLILSRFHPRCFPVELIDACGNSTYTMAWCKSSGVYAENSWFLNIGHNQLLPDGLVVISTETWNYWWLPLRRNQRVLMLLTYDYPDFAAIRHLPDDMRWEILEKHRFTRRF